MRRSTGTTLTVIAVCFSLASIIWAESPDRIQQHLDAGEFGIAAQLAEKLPERRDRWLGQIAAAQARGGATTGSQSTLRRIRDTGALTGAINAIGAENQAAGGGTMADFDTLIDLIQSTVAPDSWSDVGGTGSIESFEGGVYVDTDGVLQRLGERGAMDHSSLDQLRLQARSQHLASDDPRNASSLRMVSLPRLVRELQIRHGFGNAPTDTMRHLAGLREIRYVFFYPETDDVVIAGPAGDWRIDDEGRAVGNDRQPVLLLDDLIVLVRNASQAGGRFGCSITPQRENLARTQEFLASRRGPLRPHQTARWIEQVRATLGLQNIDIYGVDPHSHVARVLVAADYHMKLVGMGVVPSVASVTNYLDSVDAQDPPDMDVLRWWFTLRQESLAKNAKGDAFKFGNQTAQLQSENELLAATGDRIHTGKSSELNLQFADSFTSHFAELSEKYPIYRELENIFDLALVAALVQPASAGEFPDWNLAWLLDTNGYQPQLGDAPRQVPSIVNYRIVGGRRVIAGVSGGVSAQTRFVMRSMRTTQESSLDSDRDRSRGTVSRQSQRWWWD
jgi:hypothetical protein